MSSLILITILCDEAASNLNPQSSPNVLLISNTGIYALDLSGGGETFGAKKADVASPKEGLP